LDPLPHGSCIQDLVDFAAMPALHPDSSYAM
jgi:hypothetical protein